MSFPLKFVKCDKYFWNMVFPINRREAIVLIPWQGILSIS